jgi:N-acetylglucosamine kinase-like BadF-type ATPase
VTLRADSGGREGQPVIRQATGGGPRGCDVVVVIDAGGSSTRARAMRQGAVVYEGSGGPGNPLTADSRTVRASYRRALTGCPAPGKVAACVSGTGNAAQREQIADLLAGRFPGADIQVVPDYIAAFLAAPRGTDACIVAGTGSVVCSRAADGSYRVSGGRGWILGDHGSAARLGRAALEHFVSNPADVPASFAAAIGEIFGDSDYRSVVRAVQTARNPAPLLARAAPLLTAAAQAQRPWATEQLDAEMMALAATAARHIEQHIHGTPEVHIALCGGVWASQIARSSLSWEIERAGGCRVIVARSLSDPIEGAVRLAGSVCQ